jgi:hypothetical protein
VFNREKTGAPSELIRTLSALPAAELGVLFAFIDHQRLLTTDRSLDAPYTPQELQFAYSITSTEKSPKTLSQLFPAMASQSSSIASSSSSVSSITTIYIFPPPSIT